MWVSLAVFYSCTRQAQLDVAKLNFFAARAANDAGKGGHGVAGAVHIVDGGKNWILCMCMGVWVSIKEFVLLLTTLWVPSQPE